MSIRFSFKILVASIAVFLFTFALTSQANAQGGFRIGNFIEAGGGQGFRMGGPRGGMHFGGGQGTTIGTPNFGMRFGNGQGARFGGANYGMQFGGQQGTQFGQFSTTPSVTPGTYYYGDVRQPGQPRGVQPQYAPTQPTLIRPAPATGLQPTEPTIADPNLSRTNFETAPKLPTLAAPAPASTGNGTQLDIASPGTNSAESKVGKTETRSATPTLIRLKHNLAAKTPMEYTINGTAFSLSPGESVILQNGQKWTVNFPAGGSFGRRQADLKNSGTFSFFESPDEGWILIEESPVTSVRAVADDKESLENDASALANDKAANEATVPTEAKPPENVPAANEPVPAKQKKTDDSDTQKDGPIDSPFDLPDAK